MKQLLVISLISLLFPQTVQINVAIYFSFGEYAQEVKDAIDYSWIKDGVKYEIVPEIITKKEIKNGELKTHLRDVSLSGDIFSVLKNISAISEDLKFTIGFCGKEGQLVPVGDGAPEILVRDVLVGGA